jgi:hypothetical protein
MRWGWLPVLALCAGCSSLNPALRVVQAKPREDSALTMKAEDWSHVHPLQAPRPEFEKLAQAVPQDAKDHTYLFFINGLDPYYLANFRGQCQYMKSLGYANAYCGHMHHTELFRQKINKVRKDDLAARIVVIGYSTGANYARTLANELKSDNVRIDLLVYLGGDTIKDGDRSRPENVGRVLNITGHGLILLGGDLFFHGDDIKGAKNHRLDARHFLLPTRAEAAELLVQYVAELEDGTGVMQASFSARATPSER